MNYQNPENTLIAPVVTEKSLMLQEKGLYSFWVSKTSSKTQIGQAFETVFGIAPLRINTTVTNGKQKTDWKKRLPIQKSDRKKAIIYIGKDKKIDLLSLSKQK